MLDALATPKYTAAQMTAIAKIAIRGGDFARFLDPQMDARRMEAAYLVVAHGGSDLPVERLSRPQLLTINGILLRGHVPYDALKICDTPEIFLKTGFEQRPMLYTQKHLFQALTPKSDYNPHRHGFSIEQVKRFPELLASPVVLANSPTRDDVLLAILLATDAYDTPLIAGIKPDGTGNYGEREVETNMVLSVYSRQNFIRYFALLRDMNAFVFVSGRKIEALEDLSGLPLAENCSGLDIDRILQRPKCLG